MRILGVDPGSIRTGFAIVEINKQKTKCLTSGTIFLDEKLPFHHRLLALSDDLGSLITKYQPEELALESIFFAKNAQSALKLGQARGVILREAAAGKLSVFEYTPTEVKSALCGSGRANKDQIARMLCLLLKLPMAFKFASADQSDALAIALTHVQTRISKSWSNKKNDRSTFWSTQLS